jgi:hypothetical protein
LQFGWSEVGWQLSESLFSASSKDPSRGEKL